MFFCCSAHDGGDVTLHTDRPQPPAVMQSICGDTVALRSELQGLKMRRLRERADAAGVSEAEMDEAEDADQERAALIELVLSRQSSVLSLSAEQRAI
eukprot:SAG31_NODE_16564_length_704_cov_0.763636_1_plen_96_part_01